MSNPIGQAVGVIDQTSAKTHEIDVVDFTLVNTTSSTSITSPGAKTITVGSATNIVVGMTILLDGAGANAEYVPVTSASGTTIGFTCANTHTSTPYNFQATVARQICAVGDPNTFANVAAVTGGNTGTEFGIVTRPQRWRKTTSPTFTLSSNTYTTVWFDSNLDGTAFVRALIKLTNDGSGPVANAIQIQGVDDTSDSSQTNNPVVVAQCHGLASANLSLMGQITTRYWRISYGRTATGNSVTGSIYVNQFSDVPDFSIGSKAPLITVNTGSTAPSSGAILTNGKQNSILVVTSAAINTGTVDNFPALLSLSNENGGYGSGGYILDTVTTVGDTWVVTSTAIKGGTSTRIELLQNPIYLPYNHSIALLNNSGSTANPFNVTLRGYYV